MEREEIQNRENEHEQWAARALSGVREEDLFAASSVSDAEFVVALRERIGAREPRTSRRVVPALRVVSVVTSACVVLFAVIIAGPRFFSNSQSVMTMNPVDVTPALSDAMVDSLADANVNASELAAYLDVPDYGDIDEPADTADDQPLTDELLALDTGTREEVLSNLEATSFF